MPRPANHYLFFWKPTQTHGWASQWYKSPFTEASPTGDRDIQFPTAEHYMMYYKAILFNDPEIGDQILTTNNPANVKKLGQEVKDFDEEKWEANRLDIVRRGNVLKFTQNESLRDLLLATEDKILVEASPYDRIWGIGKSEANALANKDEWGLNLLGVALMQVREELRNNAKQVEKQEVAEDTV